MAVRRVLVVHPEPDVAVQLRQALGGEHYVVGCTASIRDARARWSEFAPDLVLVDATLTESIESPILRVADLELDDGAREARRRGVPIELTATEHRLLRYLMDNAGRVLSRAQLLEQVWEYDFGGDARILETYVSYLRRKLEARGAPRLIHTVRGIGYVLRAPRV